MKISTAAKLFLCVAATFPTGGLVQAESGEGRTNMSNTKSPPLHIVDRNGRPVVNAVQAPTGHIVDVQVGPGFTFSPDNINISVGDTVRWTWAGSGHSVTGGDLCTSDGQFCSSDNMNCNQGILSGQGTVYEHSFGQAGTYDYFCVAHCAFGMTGTINVLPTPSGFLYGSTGGDNASGGGRLWLIDVTNQTATLIGNTGFGYLGGIAFDSNGTLYGVAGGSGNPGILVTIDPTTGKATDIGSISDPDTHVDGLRFNSQGVLYGSAYNDIDGVGVLVAIDPVNGDILSSLTLIGSGNAFCPGIAFNSKDVLYGSRGNSSDRAEDLDLIDQVTGVLTPVGPREAIISDIVFAPDGILYGSSPTGELYTIDPITGTKTLLFNTSITQFSGLAAALAGPTPTPTATPTASATTTPTATATATSSATATATPTGTPGGTRPTPTPRPRPTPPPRP
jgi:plastocyanin